MVSRIDLDLLMTSCLMLSNDMQYVAVWHRGFRNWRLSIFLYYIFLIQIFMAQYLFIDEGFNAFYYSTVSFLEQSSNHDGIRSFNDFFSKGIDRSFGIAFVLHRLHYMVYMPRHGQHHLQFRNKYISIEREREITITKLIKKRNLFKCFSWRFSRRCCNRDFYTCLVVVLQ